MSDGVIKWPGPVDNADQLREQEEAFADLGSAVRELLDAAVRSQVSNDEATAYAAQIRQVAHELRQSAASRGLGLQVASDGHLRDHGNPVVGARNGFAPPLWIEKDAEGRRAAASFNLGAVYEGPPAHVHGGVIALLFDQVLGTVPSLIGRPGMTASLGMSYRRPTPLYEDLRMEAWLVRTEGWKTFIEGRLLDSQGRTTVEAEALFIVPKIARDYLTAMPMSDAADFELPSIRQVPGIERLGEQDSDVDRGQQEDGV